MLAPGLAQDDCRVAESGWRVGARSAQWQRFNATDLEIDPCFAKVSGKDEPDWGGKVESHQVTSLLESPPPTDSTARLQPLLWGGL